MSARKDVFDEFVAFLNENAAFFNAPYGIIESTIPGKHVGSVVAYTVTFGQARTLDATVKVFSDKKIVLESRGYYERFNGEYKDIQDLVAIFLEYIHP